MRNFMYQHCYVLQQVENCTLMYWSFDCCRVCSDNKLYYCDAGLDYVASINLNGGGWQPVYSRSQLDLHPVNMILGHRELLIADRNKT